MDNVELREAAMERNIAALLERESTRANQLADALESAAAVATERDELIDRLKAQQRQIDALSESLSEERRRHYEEEEEIKKREERALVSTRAKVRTDDGESLTTDLSSLQDHISIQNEELMKILHHLADIQPSQQQHQQQQQPQASHDLPRQYKGHEQLPTTTTRYFRGGDDAEHGPELEANFGSLITEIDSMRSRLAASTGGELSKSFSNRLDLLKSALGTLQRAQEEEREASEMRHKFDTMPNVSDGVKELMVDSLRPLAGRSPEDSSGIVDVAAKQAQTNMGAEGSSDIMQFQTIEGVHDASSSFRTEEEVGKEQDRRDNGSIEADLQSLLVWKAHAEEMMDAMRMELAESITTNIELEKRNQALEDDRRDLSLRLDESFGRISLLEKTVVSLKTAGAQNAADESYVAETQAQMQDMYQRFELLKAKYLKQSKKMRELQVKMLHVSQNGARAMTTPAGKVANDESMYPATQQAVPAAAVADVMTQAARDVGMHEMRHDEVSASDRVVFVGDSRPRPDHPRHDESGGDIERVPTDVLERMEALQDTRRRLYTAPSSQNRRPLPPEIPVPAEVLEAQRLTDEHRTALQSAPSSQLLKCIKHMDSWHEGLSDEQQQEQQRSTRPTTAPPMCDNQSSMRQLQDKSNPGASRPGKVFVPETRRNTYFEESSTERGSEIQQRGGGQRNQGVEAQPQSARVAPRTSSASVQPRQKKKTTGYGQKNQLVQRQRPSTALAGSSRKATGIAQGSRKAMKRPASARAGSRTHASMDLQLVSHPLAAAVDSRRRSHHVTVPLTPNFAEIPKCEHRRTCACETEVASSGMRRIGTAGTGNERIVKPWK